MHPYDRMPFKPEPLEALKARFPQAIARELHPAKPEFLPGALRKHVFDFGDFMVRMIVSKDSEPGMGPYIHLSFGVPPQNTSIKCAEDLKSTALGLAKHFLGDRPLIHELGTIRALHLFYHP